MMKSEIIFQMYFAIRPTGGICCHSGAVQQRAAAAAAATACCLPVAGLSESGLRAATTAPQWCSSESPARASDSVNPRLPWQAECGWRREPNRGEWRRELENGSRSSSMPAADLSRAPSSDRAVIWKPDSANDPLLQVVLWGVDN